MESVVVRYSILIQVSYRAIYIQWHLPGLGSRVAVTLSPSLGTDLLGCQRQYIRETKERKQRMKQTSYVHNRMNPYIPQLIGTLTGDHSADSAHGETPPQLVGGKTGADAIIPGRNTIKREEKEMKEQSTMKRPNCFRVLRISAPNSTPLLQWLIRTLSEKLVK
jgi:hypothetical protein